MKKLTILLIAALFTFGATANAMAVTQFDTFLSFYGIPDANGVNQNGEDLYPEAIGQYEATYSLGLPLDATDPGLPDMFAPGGSHDGSVFNIGITFDNLGTGTTAGTVNSWGDVQGAGYGYIPDSAAQGNAAAWFTALSPTTVNTAQVSNFQSGINNVASATAFGSGDLALQETDTGTSYIGNFNTGNVGNLARVIDDYVAEVNLDALDTGGSVELPLYKAPHDGSAFVGSVQQLGWFTFSLSGEELVAEYDAVPVPAPILLLGSGLLGLIGFRKRNA